MKSKKEWYKEWHNEHKQMYSHDVKPKRKNYVHGKWENKLCHAALADGVPVGIVNHALNKCQLAWYDWGYIEEFIKNIDNSLYGNDEVSKRYTDIKDAGDFSQFKNVPLVLQPDGYYTVYRDAEGKNVYAKVDAYELAYLVKTRNRYYNIVAWYHAYFEKNWRRYGYSVWYPEYTENVTSSSLKQLDAKKLADKISSWWD